MLIVCSSYNGEPPENATAFVAGLGAASWPADAFAGVSYTVFGCGDTDWAATYQAVPEAAGQRSRAAGRDPDPSARRGQRERRLRRPVPVVARRPVGRRRGPRSSCRPSRQTQAPTGPRLSISIVNRQLTNPVVLSYEATPALVTRNVELTAERHRRNPVDPTHRGGAAGRYAVPGGRSSGRAAAQQPRPHPPGHAALQAGRRHVPDDRRHQRRPHPPADRRAGAAAGHPR